MSSNGKAPEVEQHAPGAQQDGDVTPNPVELNPQEKGDSPIEHAEEALKQDAAEHLPRRQEMLEQLGIPNWQEVEKKVVRRLDMTLLPTLWILYVFNYLDRASLG